jgi:cell division protein YceG involved in septum cleavage
MDIEKPPVEKKLESAEEADVAERNAGFTENAQLVEAKKAGEIEKSIQDGTYEFDPNVSHEENMKRMKAAEKGVADRNEIFKEAA